VDEIDQHILVAMEKDGRQTIVNLAKSLGLSPSATLQRVRRLEKGGCIRGYQAVVDPGCLERGQQALIAIQVRHSSNALEHFERGLMKIDGIRSAYRVSGHYDYILHAAAKDVAHIGLMTKNEIAAIDGMSRIEAMLVFATVKSVNGWFNEGFATAREDDSLS